MHLARERLWQPQVLQVQTAFLSLLGSGHVSCWGRRGSPGRDILDTALRSPNATRGCAHCQQVHNEDVYQEGPLAAHPSLGRAFESAVLPLHPNVAEEVEREASREDVQQW